MKSPPHATPTTSSSKPEFSREWHDSFFARGIQRLFGIRAVDRLNVLFDYLLRQSGGPFSVAKIATPLGAAHPNVESHVRALEVKHAVALVRPFHGGHSNEVLRQRRAHAFDTGFTTFARG
jgi:hypothetical protein